MKTEGLMKSRFILVFFGALVLLFGREANGQATTGTIFGTVTDPTGAVVPGVEVTAVNTATNFARATLTNQEGQYTLRLLPVGEYRVEAVLPGFRKFVRTGV